MKFTIFFLIFIYNTVTALVCTNITSNPILPIGCTTIGGTLNLNSITQTELLKYSNITAVYGNLYLYSNPNVISLDGIQSITTVTGKFWLGITVRWTTGGHAIRTRHDDGAPNSNLNCSNVCNKKVIANLKNSGASEIAAQCSVPGSFICPFGDSSFERNNCPYNTTCNSICDETTCDFTAPIQRRCGDGIKDIEEECDSLQNNETECAYGDRNCQPCNSTCNILPGPGYCGDNIIDTENGEECDEEQGSLVCQYGERSCRVCISSLCKYVTGNLDYCGDGKVDTGFEECDNTTTTQCSYGTICEVCSNCTHVNQTGPYCGDNLVDTENEECDEQPISGDCNYGEPFCSICNSSSCKFVPGNVVGYCGDNKVDVVNGEQCDNETDTFCTDCLVIQYVASTYNSSNNVSSISQEPISTSSKFSESSVSIYSSNSNSGKISPSTDNSNNIDNLCAKSICNIYSDRSSDTVVFEIEALNLENDISISGNQRLSITNGSLSFAKDSVLKLDLDKNMFAAPINITTGCLDGNNGDLEIDIEDYDLSKDTRVDIVEYDCFVSEFDSVSVINSDKENLCFKGEYGQATFSVLLGANGQCLSSTTKVEINFKVLVLLFSFGSRVMF